jgi:hypothetical protein
MHGFSIFFAYLTYAHILTYWYGNMPEETEYFLLRMKTPWLYIVLIAPLLSFLIPLYGLIPKASKWTKMITCPIAIGILVAQWFTYLLVVMPEVVKSGPFGVPAIEIGMFLGVCCWKRTLFGWPCRIALGVGPFGLCPGGLAPMRYTSCGERSWVGGMISGYRSLKLIRLA